MDNFEILETGQLEQIHEQIHGRIGDGENCANLRSQHDSVAAELVKRGVMHDTEIICPESELGQRAPNYRRGFTDDICPQCAFGQLYPYCNLYKADYAKNHTCDSFQYFEILELEPPHGFLMANGKQTAIAATGPMNYDKAYLIVSNGEAFGVATLEQPAQVKKKEFDSGEWLDQHRVTQRERRQWWGDVDLFFVHRLKDWYPFDGVKLFENGQVIEEPKLTARQWKLVSRAKELPKQITLIDDAVSITDRQEFVINLSARCKALNEVLEATYQTDVTEATEADEIIPIYSLALVRNPRMRVSKKNLTVKQEGDDMPYEIREIDGEYCVVKTEDEESVGCHETREEAEEQLTALRINVEAEEDEMAMHSDKPKPRKRKPRKKESETTFAERLKLAAKNILDIITLAESEEKEIIVEDTKLFMDEIGIAQKVVNGEVWHFTYSTNAFEDREGEIFSTKALEDYVAQNEQNQEKGYFNLWHINAEDGNFNTDFAEKQWQGVIGRFLVEAGPYLDNGMGRGARKFFEQYGAGHPELAPEGWGCSPEFRYLPEERASGTYDTIWITRTSTLPKFAAANVWTETRQLKRSSKMALSEQQKKAAIEMFGEEYVNAMLKEAQDKTIELESAGVAHKSSETETEAPQTEEQAEKPQEVAIDMQALAAEIGKQFQADMTPIAEAIETFSQDMAKVKERLAELETGKAAKDKAEMPRFVFNLQRASEAEETVVTDDDGLKQQKPKETKAESGDSWSQLFNR